MGEHDALPSTQDAFPIAEPQVIITPQVTSGRVTHALMKFLPREVMVEVVEEREQGQRQERESRGLERVDISEPLGVSLRVIERPGEVQASAPLHVAAESVSAIDELAEAVAAKAAVESTIALVSTTDLAQPFRTPPSTPRVSQSRPARKRSRLAPAVVNLNETIIHTPVAEKALANQVIVNDAESPIAELAQVVAAMAKDISREEVMGSHSVALDVLVEVGDTGTLCYAASGGNGGATVSPIGPSSQLSSLDFSRLAAFADDPPAALRSSDSAVALGSRRLSRLAHWLIPDFLGRAIQHPVLQILAGIGISLLVFWWILGQ